MGQFFGTEPQPLDLFGPAHLAATAVLALIGFWFVRAGMAADERGRRRLRIGLIITIVLFRATKHWWKASAGMWTLQTDLGLHLCSIMSWITVYGLWTRRRWALHLMYFFGIAGAVQAVLTPDATFGARHYTFVETMVSHGILVMAGAWAVTVEGYRPTARDPWLALGLLNLYAVVMYPLNPAPRIQLSLCDRQAGDGFHTGLFSGVAVVHSPHRARGHRALPRALSALPQVCRGSTLRAVIVIRLFLCRTMLKRKERQSLHSPSVTTVSRPRV